MSDARKLVQTKGADRHRGPLLRNHNMKQKTSGMVALAGILALAGCYTYQGDAVNNASYNEVQATPNFIVVRAGDSDQMLVRLINAASNGALTNYTLGPIPAGILVHQNLNYRPVYDPKLDTLVPTGDKTAQQYFIVGVTPGKYTFTLTPTAVNTGVSATVTVAVTSLNLGAALSKTTGATGDTITVTAPPGLVFSQSSVITFPGGFTPVIVSRSADSTSFRFVAGPGTGGVTAGTAGVGTVTKVGVFAVPEQAVATDTTTNTYITPAAPTTLSPVISNLTPNLGDNITVTLPAGYRFVATSTLSTANSGGDVVGTFISMNADSTSAVWNPNPLSNGNLKMNNIAYTVFPTGPFNAVASPAQVVHVIAPTIAPTTVSNTTPDIGVPITVTLGGNIKFRSDARIFIGGVEGGLTNFSADSSSATALPLAYSSGLITYKNVVLNTVPSVPLNLTGDKSVTVSSVYAGPTDANAATVAGATTYTVPSNGTLIISDGGTLTTPCSSQGFGGGAVCRYYKIVFPAETVTGRIVWTDAAHVDLGVYTLNAAGTSAATEIADEGGGASGSEGDVGPGTSPKLAAGTFIVAVASFGAPPASLTWYQFRVAKP
jgi:hypothetical protein